MIHRTVAAAFALVAFVVPALALTEADKAEFRRNCTSDYSRLCAAYDPDSAEVQKCFRDKIKQVTPRCQATIQKLGGAAR